MHLRKFLGMLGGVSTLVGCLSRDVGSERPRGIRGAVAEQLDGQARLDWVDVVVVVDDSASMLDKQQVLRDSLSWLGGYATMCNSMETGAYAEPQNGVCPEGFQFTSILNGDFAVIRTSVGAGGIACEAAESGAHPLASAGTERPMDPSGVAPLIDRIGEMGCGYEAPLEAAYRFLVDPDPPLQVGTAEVEGETVTVAQGFDAALLGERESFLDPVSQVIVIILTDEDDCSVRDSGRAWRIGAEPGLPRATAICAAAPNDPCCRSCGAPDPEPELGCLPAVDDPGCSAPGVWDAAEDAPNVRCWDSKRRFGEDWLFPLERYREAFTSPLLTSRSGASVVNPLFEHGRTPDMVSFLVLAGVPWQLITSGQSGEDPGVMEFLSPGELESSGAWSRLLGDPGRDIAPSDAHLIASSVPRLGLPLAGEPLDPISGHEVVRTEPEDLQYSCIFPLPEPRDCAVESSCDCSGAPASPLCLQEDGTYGTQQRFAKAYPPPRLLEFTKLLGPQGHLGSICPRQLDDPRASGFGYSDAIRSFYDRSSRAMWDMSCFHPALPVEGDGTPRCRLIEGHIDAADCASLGRVNAEPRYVDAFIKTVGWRSGVAEWRTFCEIPRLEGRPSDPSSAYSACANQVNPPQGLRGYCYIDAELGLGNPELVDFCAPHHQRRVRLIPQNLPEPRTFTGLVCDYGE